VPEAFLLPNATQIDRGTVILGFGWYRGEMLALVVALLRGKPPFNNHTAPVVMTEMSFQCNCNLRVTVAAPFGSGNYNYIAFRYATAAVLPSFRGLAAGMSPSLRSSEHVTAMSV